MLKLLILFVVMAALFSSPLSSSTPVDVRPEPPVSDPVLPTEKEPIFQASSSSGAHSPGATDVRTVQHQNLNKKILIALIVASTLLGGILLLLSGIWVYRLSKLKKSNEKCQQNADGAKGLSCCPVKDKSTPFKASGRKGLVAVLEYPSLLAATNNFMEENVLGEGRLGRVYKAKFDNDFEAAVKRLCGGRQEVIKEFENEVDLLSKIQHQNIVPLLGYSIHGDMRFLVYEMMQNSSLEFQLHGPSRGSALSWPLRMKIALDVARGLEYLHERCNPPVIHRHLKSSNILLDSSFNARISDFGLSVTGGNLNKNITKISGSLGYLAPEYLLDGKLTDKSDVYAFGIILLELLMGKRPVEKVGETKCQSIVTWAMPQLTDRSKLPNIVDSTIRNTMDVKHLYQVAAVAVLCVQPEPSYRPLITDVLHSFIPLVPNELGGSLRVVDSTPCTSS
nr:probable receptor-like protein kinase At1g80640 [Ipomoea batatas]